MVFLNAWILFAFIPLFLIYKKNIHSDTSRQIKLLYASLFFMLVAIAQPVLKHSIANQKFHSQEYIIAIDASYSMQADDLQPSRYAVAKQAIIKLLKLHPKDRFSIFAFTSNTLLISPPTTDSSIGIAALQTLNPEYILTKSTSLYQLFTTVTKIPSHERKNLIIFSDGGDETDISQLSDILKKNNIMPYFVATATQKGAALKKDGKYLKNLNASLVVSKINPLLQDLASMSKGKYYELQSLKTIDTLSNDITQKASKKEQTLQVQSYKELFYIPLLIALILYFIAVTKLHQLYLLMPFLLLMPYKADAALLDFYYLHQANKDIKESKYAQAALAFSHLEPSVKSYYNIASSYYKSGQYKNALRYYQNIQTKNRAIKQAILYNMANCAVKLGRYDKAKLYYMYALALKEDKDALYNLNLIRMLQTKQETPKPPPQKNSQKKKKSVNSQKKEDTNKKSSKSNSNRNSEQTTNGSGGEKKKKNKGSIKNSAVHKASNYKLGYKAYEIINKGYADEKEPW